MNQSAIFLYWKSISRNTTHPHSVNGYSIIIYFTCGVSIPLIPRWLFPVVSVS